MNMSHAYRSLLFLLTAAAAGSAASAGWAESSRTFATLRFLPHSVEIDGVARTELGKVIRETRGLRTIVLRAYASGGDPEDARKVALARGLSVRTYLIDAGLRANIEVAAAAGGGSAADDRVEIVDR